MGFDRFHLFFAAAVFYFIFLLVCLLKKKATLRGQFGFFCIFAGSVMWLSIYCFPFSTTSMSYRKGWSLLPFGNIAMLLKEGNTLSRTIFSSVFRYLLLAFLMAVVYSFCFSLLARRATLAGAMLKTTGLLVVLQIIGIWCMLYAHTLEHPFDTSVVLADLAGSALGYLCYRLLVKGKEGAPT